jgi:hypothetical protein
MITPSDVRREYDDREGHDREGPLMEGADPDCPMCHGEGYVTDWVPRPFGPGNVPMMTTCECVEGDE